MQCNCPINHVNAYHRTSASRRVDHGVHYDFYRYDVFCFLWIMFLGFIPSFSLSAMCRRDYVPPCLLNALLYTVHAMCDSACSAGIAPPSSDLPLYLLYGCCGSPRGPVRSACGRWLCCEKTAHQAFGNNGWGCHYHTGL